MRHFDKLVNRSVVGKPTRTRADVGRQKRARTRAALMDAAMRVFARQGPAAATIDDVIAEASVARGTFYNYYDTIEDLLVAVASDLSDQFLVEMAAFRDLSDPADRVACSVRSYIRKAAADPVWGGVIVRIALLAAPLGANMRNFLTADLEAGLSAGRFRLPSLRAGQDAVLGLGLMGMRAVLQGNVPTSHAEDIATLVLRVLGVVDAAQTAVQPLDQVALAKRSGTASSREPGT